MSRSEIRGWGWGWVAAPVALLAGALALASAARAPGSTDDLFVVLVYARNLLEHGALAHELGEGRLEGFTSPLDLALKTLALALGGPDGVRAAWLETSGAYAGALLAATWAAVRLGAGRPTAVLLGAAALVLTPGLAEGTTYLLETPLLLALLALAAGGLSGARRPARAAGLGLALVLARPEAALVALAWAWPVGRVGRVGAGGEPAAPGRWRPLIAVGLMLAGVLVLRWALFGRLAPNSFHAKASDSPARECADGLRYVWDHLTLGGWWGGPARVALVAATLAAPLLARGAPGRVRVLARAAPLALLALVVSGGDAYAGARLLAPPLFLGGLALVAVAGAGSGRPRVLAVAGLSLVVATRAVEVGGDAPAKLRALTSGGLSQADFEAERRALRALVARLPARSTLAARHLQLAEYYAPELRFLDLTGLNERTVADAPAPGAVRFGRTSLSPALDAAVEVIHLHHLLLSSQVLAERSTGGWIEGTDEERARVGDPLPEGERAQLARRYRTVTLPHAGGPGRHLNLLLREDLAARWAADPGLRVGPR